MRIGIDIDDVIFRTSEMIKSETPRLLRNKGIVAEPDLSKVFLQDMFANTLSSEDIAWLDTQLPWCTTSYIDGTALRELRRYKKLHPEVELCIVTKRPEQQANPIVELASNYYYCLFDKVFCLNESASKVTFCEENGIDVLFEDQSAQVKEFNPAMHCKAVLVSTEYVKHNKDFAETYSNVLYDWMDIDQILEKLPIQGIT